MKRGKKLGVGERCAGRNGHDVICGDLRGARGAGMKLVVVVVMVILR